MGLTKYEIMLKRPIIRAQSRQCGICSERLFFKKEGIEKTPTFDHVYPASGGHQLLGNAVIVHSKCNLEKGNTMPSEYQLSVLAKVNEVLGWNGVFYENVPGADKKLSSLKWLIENKPDLVPTGFTYDIRRRFSI